MDVSRIGSDSGKWYVLGAMRTGLRTDKDYFLRTRALDWRHELGHGSIDYEISWLLLLSEHRSVPKCKKFGFSYTVRLFLHR